MSANPNRQKPTQENITPDVEDPSCWPIAVDEERNLLGACLMGRGAEICKLATLDLFGLTSNRKIFLAIAALVEAGEGAGGAWIEFVALASELASRGQLEAVGGLATIVDLTTDVLPARPLERRLRRLREFAIRRAGLRLTVELWRRYRDLTEAVEDTDAWHRSQM